MKKTSERLRRGGSHRRDGFDHVEACERVVGPAKSVFWGGVAAAGAITGAVVGSAVAAAPYTTHHTLTMGHTPTLTRGAQACGTAMPGYAAATDARPA